jgi:hypothetical protein
MFYDFWAQRAKHPTRPAEPTSHSSRITESPNRQGAHFGRIAESLILAESSRRSFWPNRQIARPCSAIGPTLPVCLHPSVPGRQEAAPEIQRLQRSEDGERPGQDRGALRSDVVIPAEGVGGQGLSPSRPPCPPRTNPHRSCWALPLPLSSHPLTPLSPHSRHTVCFRSRLPRRRRRPPTEHTGRVLCRVAAGTDYRSHRPTGSQAIGHNETRSAPQQHSHQSMGGDEANGP